MNNSPNKQDIKDREGEEEEEEEEEDALSLCDFPLNSGEAERNNNSSKTHHRRRSSQPSDSFEFSNDLDSGNLSHAEDIIHCGKLKPYKQQEQKPLFNGDRIFILSENYDSENFSRRHCDSLPQRSTPTRLTRSSRSLDRKKLRRNSSLVMKSEASEIHRSLSESLAKSDASKGWKPKWYDLMFGSVKFPPEIDLRDMKNRQIRLNSGSMFAAAADGGDGTPANRRDRTSSWGHDLLRVLSCKNHPSSVAVTASIGLVPHS